MTPNPDRTCDTLACGCSGNIVSSAATARSATDVERVLGGVAPHLMVTDPPYLSGQPDPHDQPAINPRYLAGDTDHRAMVGGFKFLSRYLGEKCLF